MGADAVVTGGGEAVWSQAVQDALEGHLQRQYVGGRIPGEAMLRARWDLSRVRVRLEPSGVVSVGVSQG
jgi:hypothetical protein